MFDTCLCPIPLPAGSHEEKEEEDEEEENEDKEGEEEGLLQVFEGDYCLIVVYFSVCLSVTRSHLCQSICLSVYLCDCASSSLSLSASLHPNFCLLPSLASYEKKANWNILVRTGKICQNSTQKCHVLEPIYQQ